MKTLTWSVILIMIMLGTDCLGANELQQGQLVNSLEGKVKLLLGDKAITNLGKKDGVIKGDILQIYDKKDTALINSIGKCAVIEMISDRDDRSICEIIKMNKEISGDTVTLKKIRYSDANLYPAILQLLTKVVEPYKPFEDIRVYVYNIFDDKNNVTLFSENVKKEIKNIFYQKKRIKVVEGNVSQALYAYYPQEYGESNAIIEEYLKKDNIDVIIAGNYKVSGEKIELTFYKIDKNWEDIAVDTKISSTNYANSVSNITVPYNPRKKEQNLLCNIVYKPVFYKANIRDERNDIIEKESKNNPFLEYNLKRIDFNIISPVDFKLEVDKYVYTFEKDKEYMLFLPTGEHNITASFKKGYYANDSLLFTSEDVIKKSIVLYLDKPDDLKIEIKANPLPESKNIEFDVRKVSLTKPTPQMNQIMGATKNGKTVETFKD